MRALTFAEPSADYDKFFRRLAKLDELDKHDERDRKRWHAGMDRLIANSSRWNAMYDEREASKEATA